MLIADDISLDHWRLLVIDHLTDTDDDCRLLTHHWCRAEPHAADQGHRITPLPNQTHRDIVCNASVGLMAKEAAKPHAVPDEWIKVPVAVFKVPKRFGVDVAKMLSSFYDVTEHFSQLKKRKMIKSVRAKSPHDL